MKYIFLDDKNHPWWKSWHQTKGGHMYADYNSKVRSRNYDKAWLLTHGLNFNSWRNILKEYE